MNKLQKLEKINPEECFAQMRNCSSNCYNVLNFILLKTDE